MKWRKKHPRLRPGLIRIRSLIKQIRLHTQEIKEKIRLFKKMQK